MREKGYGYHIFERKDGKHLAWFGYDGHGPFEGIDPLPWRAVMLAALAAVEGK